MNTMTNNNPFQNPEPRQILFESTPSYQKLKKSSLQQFYRQQNQNTDAYFYKPTFIESFFMTINNLFHKFTLAAVSLSLLILLALTTVTAQAFAPDELKPSNIVSNLFAANKQPDKDPQTQLAPNSVLAKNDPSLSPDDDNYVVNLEGCDLAIKAPKKVRNLKPTFDTDSVSTYSHFSTLFVLPESDTFGSLGSTSYEIRCNSNKNPEGTILSSSYMINQPELGFGMKKITKDELQTKTGWFVTAADITNIYVKEELPVEIAKLQQPYNYDFYNDASILEKKYGKMINSVYYFVYNNIEYGVELSGFSDIIKPQLMQLQFNSLVKNTFSPELLANTEGVVKDCTTLFTVKTDISITKESTKQTDKSCGIFIKNNSVDITLTVDYATPNGNPPVDFDITGAASDNPGKNIKISGLPKVLDDNLVKRIDPSKVYSFKKGFEKKIYSSEDVYRFMDTNNNVYTLEIFKFNQFIFTDQIQINYIK